MSITKDVFGLLDTDTLYGLHTSLYERAERIHIQMLDSNGNPLIPIFGDQWNELSASHSAILRTMTIISDVLAERKISKDSADA